MSQPYSTYTLDTVSDQDFQIAMYGTGMSQMPDGRWCRVMSNNETPAAALCSVSPMSISDLKNYVKQTATKPGTISCTTIQDSSFPGRVCQFTNQQ